MADERDFQLLDDYLTNRMSEHEKSAFEQKLQADPDLKSEFSLQQRLIKGIRDARVADLKSMLNNIPVSAAGPEKTVASKILLGALISILIAGAAYWYFKTDHVKVATPEAPVNEEVIEQPVPAQPETTTESTAKKQPGKTVVPPVVEKDKNQTSAGTEHSKPSQAKKPAPLTAPRAKASESDTPLQESFPDVSDPATEENADHVRIIKDLVVETETQNEAYAFHYQFKEGKLFLFGPFEQNGYEIVELSTRDERTIFLLHNNKYYQLDQDDVRIKPLAAVTDAALLEKLKSEK